MVYCTGLAIGLFENPDQLTQQRQVLPASWVALEVALQKLLSDLPKTA